MTLIQIALSALIVLGLSFFIATEYVALVDRAPGTGARHRAPGMPRMLPTRRQLSFGFAG
jgi:hypothetical protein